MSKLNEQIIIDKTNAFKEESTKKHNNKYDYSKIGFIYNYKNEVEVICPKHGSFWVLANLHKIGKGVCPDCKKKHLFPNNELFIEHLDKLYDKKFDFSKCVYKTHKLRKGNTVCCFIHGDFYVKTKDLLEKNISCPTCTSKKMNTQYYIELANLAHNNRFDYSKTLYISASEHIVITCKEHGDFLQKADHHLLGQVGCKQCINYNLSQKSKSRARFRPDTFETLSIQTWGDIYDLSLVNCVDYKTPVIIVCKTHGPFERQPAQFITKKRGCPKCGYELGKIKTRENLKKLNDRKRLESKQKKELLEETNEQVIEETCVE